MKTLNLGLSRYDNLSVGFINAFGEKRAIKSVKVSILNPPMYMIFSNLGTTDGQGFPHVLSLLMQVQPQKIFEFNDVDELNVWLHNGSEG